MRAIQLNRDSEQKIEIIDKELPSPGLCQCVIKIKAAALNRRDQWIREGLYPGLKDGVTLGSDGCGVVESGPDEWVGKRVIFNPNIDWGDDPKVQAGSYHILGMPTHGTLAEYALICSNKLALAPTHLSDTEAATLPLGGLTAYRACITKGQIKKDSKVLITGIGGGVSQFALQIANILGAAVWVTSGSGNKIDRSVKAGAKGGFNYREDNWVKSAMSNGPFDVIIDSAGGESLNHYLKLIKPGGKIIMYGSTLGRTPQLDTARLFWSQAQILGSTMGNDQEFIEMVDFYNRHKLHPVIDQVFELNEYLEAFDRFKAQDHYGKIVIKF